MLKNYTLNEPKLPLSKNITLSKKQDLRKTTLQNILNFSKALEVVKNKKESIELILN
jgi:hypothetical protein